MRPLWCGLYEKIGVVLCKCVQDAFLENVQAGTHNMFDD